ncbi:MAG TPA: hypothetical protein DCG57_21240 [Candidatus Riflebacteria bacterium]|nr:hypothetical protein [Candidatus Riflebacteria bacterium]
MKQLIKLVLPLLLLACIFFSARVEAISLTDKEVKLINSIAVFIDRKPEGRALRLIESAMRSSNVALRGMAALVLFKHYGESFRGQLLRNFTLNPANDSFAVEKTVLVKMENIDRLLATYAELMKSFKDERTRQLFLFYHFRHKQVFMLGSAGEQLSLAAFYRISLLENVLGASHDVTDVLIKADS